jgi:hypothetical protein
MPTFAEKIAAGLSSLNLFGKDKRDDDPLTNIKLATRWADNLPTGDALMSQNAILQKLKRQNENLTQLSREQLAILMLLDEKSRDLQDTLVQQYLRNPRMSRVMESRLWHEINNLYWELARGYHAFVLDFSRLHSVTRDDALMPLITLRGIRAFGLLLKWRAIRYLQNEEKIWLRLHKLYRIAETEGFQQKKIQMYPSDPNLRCCQSSYLQTLMLDLANSGTLYPRQLHLVDCWLDKWSATLRLEPTLDLDRHTFSIDLSADYGPRRTRKADSDKPTRHWQVTTLLTHLDATRQSLHDGLAPPQLGLGDATRSSESLELLTHLQLRWSPAASREQRRAPREQVKLRLEICHGLEPVIDHFKPGDDEPVSGFSDSLMPDLEADDIQIYGFVTARTREAAAQLKAQTTQRPGVESWVVQDESANGYGAVVPTQDKGWLRVGALVAMRTRQAESWRLGTIRRLARINEDNSSVGIEVFAGLPQLAMLHDTGAHEGYTVNGLNNSRALASLWLDAADGKPSIVMDPAHFQREKEFEVYGVPGIGTLRLGHPVERSEGWIRVAILAAKP